MQHKRNGISGDPIEIRPYAEFKQDKAIKACRIRINELSMASRRIVDENQEMAGWFCLRITPGREGSVENILTDEDIYVRVLREPEETVIRRGRIWALPGRPWLVGFVLVRCVPSPAAFRGLLGLKYVIEVVGGWATPFKVSDAAMNKFNEVMAEREEEREKKRREQEAKNASIAIGDKVIIKLGPFAGFDAIVLKVGKGKEKRCKLQYRLFGRDGEVDIPLANLEKL